ncbi:UMP kinase [uncultured Helcococcus sp.]|uniref:UMP kinase n=1 Tax=uncultured Helcococcus sp. TaxID=1072508 RepID=UPI0026176DA3|nr:UMP kinase [uncultured Helcococcus sp.]
MSKYKRVLIKLSGESLAGNKGFGMDDQAIMNIAHVLKNVHEEGVEIAIVVGGGNFWRGRDTDDMDRTTSDNIGMLGTVMNALRVQSALEALDLETRVQTAIKMDEVAEPFIVRKAIRHLEKGRIVIFAAGTGHPYFSTDTTSALRALEIQADAMLMGKTGTDGIYDKDPNKYDDAVKYDKLTYREMLEKNLQVMDAAATSLAKDNEMPVIVFGIDDPNNLIKVINGEEIGTYVGG